MITLGAGILLFILFVGLAIVETFWPISVAIVIGLAYSWYYNISLWFLVNPFYISAYLGIGLPWIFFKWTREVEDHAKRYKKNKGTSQEGYFSTPPKWESSEHSYFASYFYWPVDVVAYFLSDLLVDFWEFISKTVSKTFNDYAKRRFEAIK